jgi:hypothetical protein
MQENQGSHVNKSVGEKLEHSCTMHAGKQKQNSASTEEEDNENHQQRNDVSKLTEKIWKCILSGDTNRN